MLKSLYSDLTQQCQTDLDALKKHIRGSESDPWNCNGELKLFGSQGHLSNSTALSENLGFFVSYE